MIEKQFGNVMGHYPISAGPLGGISFEGISARMVVSIKKYVFVLPFELPPVASSLMVALLHLHFNPPSSCCIPKYPSHSALRY